MFQVFRVFVYGCARYIGNNYSDLFRRLIIQLLLIIMSFHRKRNAFGVKIKRNCKIIFFFLNNYEFLQARIARI